jgi:aspartyl-tRNA(Asn)/glutamyl-tRNA(Gln) amidotransferase subunit A
MVADGIGAEFEREALSRADRLEECLAAIDRFNPVIRSMITVLGADAREAVTKRNGAAGALHGRIVSVKDNIDTAGVRTTRGSAWFADRLPNDDAEVVQRLRRAGAILIGKDNLHEFAFGATSQNPHHGACRNPWNIDTIPGGSSGGSGASVAAGFSEISLGTDTGGSVRIPAALNGVSGLRPTVGRISNHGVMPVSADFDTVGPLARRARDVASAYEVIAGYDARDPISERKPVESWAGLHARGLRGLRIGVPWTIIEAECEAGVMALLRGAEGIFTDLGASISRIEIDGFGDAQLSLQTCAQVDAAVVHQERMAEDPSRFGRDVEHRLRLGAETPASAYSRARTYRHAWTRRVEGLFNHVDMIAMPTVGFPAPLASDAVDMLGATRRLTRLCGPWSFAGVPALSIPCGFERGMPIGLQLIAPQWSEALLLAAGVAFQEVTDFHLKRPGVLADAVADRVGSAGPALGE